jgi:hypothetical protein
MGDFGGGGEGVTDEALQTKQFIRAVWLDSRWNHFTDYVQNNWLRMTEYSPQLTTIYV